jgi:hypothetical protein
MSEKNEFGDFQTPRDLARQVVGLVHQLYGVPDLVIEPTAGLGSFLKEASDKWKALAQYEGYEINPEYVRRAGEAASQFGVRFFHCDFFSENWKAKLSRLGNRRVLIIGNPPWVTNSDLGLIGSNNLPAKSNFQGLRGMDARTGKSNFDIAESMLIKLVDALPEDGALAMLCKTMTARKVLRHFWKTEGGREGAKLFQIDAKAHFGVSVDACLLYISGRRSSDRVAAVYSDLTTQSPSTGFGFIDGELVSDINLYNRYKRFSGGSSLYAWRSGIKHDAAKIMEFHRSGDTLVNGYGELVDIESDYVFPLLKSSDLGNGRTYLRKSVLVTQSHTGDDTLEIKRKAPKTWNYLVTHGEDLDNRKSSIYTNRPRFSVFGIGPYSFSPWKIAISGLYKKLSFVVVPPYEGRPVMVDDTCYSIACQSEEEASLLVELLTSPMANKFLQSLIFTDSKRPITVDLLRRVSFVELARELGRLEELQRYVNGKYNTDEKGNQMLFLMEPKGRYLTSRELKTSLASRPGPGVS